MLKYSVLLSVLLLAALMSGCSETRIETPDCECTEVVIVKLDENVGVTCSGGVLVYTWIGETENLDDIRED